MWPIRVNLLEQGFLWEHPSITQGVHVLCLAPLTKLGYHKLHFVLFELASSAEAQDVRLVENEGFHVDDA